MLSASTSTAPARTPYRRAARARLGRRLFLVLLGAFLLLGLLSFFGYESGTVSATANGYRLTVVYPQATRSSLPVRWQMLVGRTGGFRGPVRIAMPIAYFNLFDFNNFYPLPDSTLNQGGKVILIFPPPAGDVLNVLLDARTQPGLKWGMTTTTAIVDHDNRPLVEVRYSTRVVP
jgi:hypothetical protein